MPLDYTYGNNGIVALAASRIGQSAFEQADEKRKFDEALRLANLQQQADQFAIQADQRQQGIDLNQYNNNRNFNYGVARDRTNAQAAQDRAIMEQQEAARAFERDMYAKNLGSQQEQDSLRLQDSLKRAQLDQANAAQRELLQTERGFDEVDAVDTDAREMLKLYRTTQLTDEGQKIFGEYSNKIRRLQGQRKTMRPQQYVQAMGQVLAEMEEQGIEDMKLQPPTIQQRLNDGSLLDKGDHYLDINRNGSTSILNKPPPQKPEVPLIDTPLGKMTEERWQDKYDDYISRATDILKERVNDKGDKMVPQWSEIEDLAGQMMQGSARYRQMAEPGRAGFGLEAQQQQGSQPAGPLLTQEMAPGVNQPLQTPVGPMSSGPIQNMPWQAPGGQQPPPMQPGQGTMGPQPGAMPDPMQFGQQQPGQGAMGPQPGSMPDPMSFDQQPQAPQADQMEVAPPMTVAEFAQQRMAEGLNEWEIPRELDAYELETGRRLVGMGDVSFGDVKPPEYRDLERLRLAYEMEDDPKRKSERLKELQLSERMVEVGDKHLARRKQRMEELGLTPKEFQVLERISPVDALSSWNTVRQEMEAEYALADQAPDRKTKEMHYKRAQEMFDERQAAAKQGVALHRNKDSDRRAILQDVLEAKPFRWISERSEAVASKVGGVPGEIFSGQGFNDQTMRNMESTRDDNAAMDKLRSQKMAEVAGWDDPQPAPRHLPPQIRQSAPASEFQQQPPQPAPAPPKAEVPDGAETFAMPTQDGRIERQTLEQAIASMGPPPPEATAFQVRSKEELALYPYGWFKGPDGVLLFKTADGKIIDPR